MLKNDLKNDIEKTLQAHCPEPPKGFAERMDNKAISLIQKKHAQKTNKGKSRFRLPVLAVAAVLVLCFVTAASRDLIIRPDEIRARETTTPLVTALSEGKGEATEGEGLSQEAIEELESKYPGLINELKPVNLNSEQQGVRLDLISALIKDQDLYMLYTIQDLEGERVGDDLRIFYDDNFSSGDGRQNILRLDYDEANHKGAYLRKCEMNRAARSTDQVRMSFQDLGTSEYFYIDLNPLLEQYGKPAEGVALPEDLSVQSDNPDIISDMYSSVLDYTQPLDESLCGPVKLTGIGWIDNKLHVQTHDTEASVTTIGRGSCSSWMISIQAKITDKDDRRNVDYDTLSWGYTDEGHPVWQEDVMKVSPEEKDQLKLLAHVTHLTNTLEATWEFKVPVDSIMADAGAETAVLEAERLSAADEPILRECFEHIYPEVSYDEMIPISGLSAEDQGIRVDVISGCIKENKASILLSVKDDENRYAYGLNLNLSGNRVMEDSHTGKLVKLLNKFDENESFWIYEMEMPDDPDSIANLTFKTNQIGVSEEKSIDLIPFLKEYGKKTEGIEPPELHPAFSKTSYPGLRILDYTQPLDIPLMENVKLTGIGWIDNRLHTQIHFTADPIWTSDDTGYAGAGVNVYNSVTNDVVWPLGWNDNGDEFPDWMESVMDVRPEDLERLTLTADVWENKEIVEGNWEIQVPADMFQEETATPLVTALSEGKGEETVPGGTGEAGNGTENQSALPFEDALRLEMESWPGIAEELKPVNLSCEKQGFRMDVISALVKGNEYWVVYSVKDLEGDRINTFYDPLIFDNLAEDASETDGTSFFCDNPEYGKIYMTHKVFSEPILPEDGKLTLDVKDIPLGSLTELDLIPLLKQYGQNSEGVIPLQAIWLPNLDKVYVDESAKDLGIKVLDYNKPLDVELGENVFLSGIGWIGDQLHVQVQCRENKVYGLTGSPERYGYDRYMVSVVNYPKEGGWSLADEQSPVMWGVNEPASYKSEWKEFVFNSTPADVDRMQLKIRISEVTGVVEDNWAIQVPVSAILEKMGEEPSANSQNESDEQIKGTLWAFFTDWVGQDTGYLLGVCADEWKDRQPDPEKAARELMASGKPGRYIINGISGKDNDQVRTVDLTVQWDAGTYNRYEIPFRLQQITPAMEAYRVDPDGFGNRTAAEPVPENELVLLTEEEIVRKAISYSDLSYDDFIPLNLGMEKQGIRMEVISGCVKGQDLYILCSLQDLERRYDGLDMEIEQWFKPEAPRMGYSRPYSNYAENKSFWLFFIEQFAQYRAEDGTIPFGIDLVRFENDESFNILPFLEKYGKETEGVNAPENARLTGDEESTENLKILDYTNPLDVPLTQTAKLTGIGWINNQLHVQMHAAEETIQTESGTSFPATTVSVYDPFSSQSGYLAQWDENGDWFMDWYEFVLDIRPENAAQRWICAEVRETKGVVDDNWEVQIPIDVFLSENRGNTAVQDEAAAAAEEWAEYELKGNFGECLWWFFWNWKQGNTDYVTEAFRHEWNTNQADPEESAKEIMKAGTPGGYKIHSVSGKLGDPDCKADVTVLWQEGESSYTCTRHELEFWLEKDENGELQYAINPEGFKNGSANETFPDNPVLMREDNIIREVMAAHIEDVSYEELVPIGLSTEKQGMQVEVVSGCRKGDKAYLLLTTKDLNGEYSEYDCDPLFESELNYTRLCVNQAEGKTTWLCRTDLSKELPTENNTLRTGITQFSFREDREIDLLPMLKEYGKTEEGVTPPKESPRFTLDGKPMENKLKALKYEESLDIHLNGNVFLSAIGWIDDQLHVQFQNKSWAMMEEYPDVPYASYMIIANCHVEDKTYEEIKVDSSPMSWLNTDGTSWNEYVFNCMPEDLDRMKLYATGTVFKAMLEDDWTVEVPMNMLPDLNAAAEPSVQEVETTAESLTLEEKISREIEEYWPGIAKELKPVNLNCEKEGIRAEVIYALIKDQKLYVVYSLQDLEGDRIKDNLNTYYLDNLGGTGLYSMRLDWDETEEHKATFLKVYDIPEPVQPDGKLVVNLIGLMTEEVTTIDLLPLLKKYGKTVEGVDKPEDTLAETLDWSTGSFANVDLSKYPTILDYTQPLDETLCGPVSLTGIGWIDNKLHVQIHNPDETTCTIGNTTYLSWMGTPRLAITEEKDSRNPAYDELSWGIFSNGETAWKKYAEYVWEIAPDDINHLELKADIYHHKKISDTTWKIEIPIASIQAKTDENTAVPEIEQTATAEPLVIEEEVNRQLEEKWPDIAKELKPVNMSCEKQGIRLEVLSALVKGNEAWAVYTLEDMTGDHGAPEEGYCVGGYEKDTEGKEPKTETYLLQRTSETGRRQIYIKHIEAKNPLRTEKDAFTVGIEQVCVSRYKQIDLIPFLKEYGKNEEGIELPELHPAFSKTAREGMKILDYTQPLDISLLENVKLTGIGWIDNQLHTQIHFTADPIRTSDGAGHAGAGVNVYNSVTNDVVWPLGWNDNGDEFPDWMESVMDVKPDDLGQLTLTAEVWENKEILEDNWEVKIPLEEVLAEDEVITE